MWRLLRGDELSYRFFDSDPPCNLTWAPRCSFAIQMPTSRPPELVLLPLRSSPPSHSIHPGQNPNHTRYPVRQHRTMALRVSATMAVCLLFSLVAVTHCVPVEADLATNATSIAVPSAAVHAVPDGQQLLRLPSSDDSVVSDAVFRDGDVSGEGEEAVKPVAEPDPDGSHPDSDGDEELTAKKLSPEGQESDEKTNEQIDDDEDEAEEEKKTKKNHDGDDKEKEKNKKRKKHHDGACKGKKEKKTKKNHQSNGEEEEAEEKTHKQIHRHHRVVEKETKKQPHHNKNKNKNNDSDDEDDQEKKAKRWRKAISRNGFGHGRRSQREEAQTEEVKN